MTVTSIRQPVLDAAALNDFLDRHFPEIHEGGRAFSVEAVGPMTCRMRMTYHKRHLRPGGTISGPAMFALADVCLYIATMAHIGPVALAVTTNLSINFLIPAKAGTA